MRNQQHFPLTLVVAIFLLNLASCSTAPVYQVQDHEFETRPGTSLQKIEQAIVRGSKYAGWQTSKI